MIGHRHQPGQPGLPRRAARRPERAELRPAAVASALEVIEAAGLPRRVMVDASHGNSGKDHRRQEAVAVAVAGQVAAGERGIAGVMLESILMAGRQEPGRRSALVYGQSVTDPCMDCLRHRVGAGDPRRRRAGAPRHGGSLR